MNKEDQIKNIIRTQFEKNSWNVKELTLDTNFVGDLGADSLDQVELLMTFEEVFDIEVSDADAWQIETIGDAVKYIKANT